MDARLVEAATWGKVDVLSQPPFQNSNDLLLQTTPMGNSALHIAVRFGQTQFCVELCRQCHSLIWKKNLKDDTPLHIAARTGQFSIMEFLVREIVSITTPLRDVENGELHAHDILRMGNGEKNTALHEAIRNRHLEVVTLLTAVDPELWYFTNEAGESPLFLATLYGFQDMVLQALRRSRSLPHHGPNGRTVLRAAVIGGHIGIVRILVEESRELVKEQDSDGKTALHYAASIGDVTTVELLLKSDPATAYILDSDGCSPLHEAAISGHVHIIEKLLQHCPDIVDLSDLEGQNALHVAIKSRKLHVVEYLLSKNELQGLVNQRDNNGNTPLHLAAIHCSLGVVGKLLNDRRVDLRAENKDGQTALAVVQLGTKQTKIFRKFLVWRKLIGANDSSFWSQPVTTRKYKPPAQAKSTKESYNDKVNTLLVVATLIVTVTLSAALTMPGGYRNEASNQGTAVLIRKAAFIAFVIFDALAMGHAICAVFLLLSASIADHEAIAEIVSLAIVYTLTSLGLLTLAFSVAFYAVLSTLPWLAILVCYLICSVPLALTIISFVDQLSILFKLIYFHCSPKE
ncbi:hypothetical protein HHK36_009084 [Tetracentron sinense]|uniref:PGG domain-containing protein n=1 Tax=Tetracentron sinense TaxID=13715 RepID=A0A834ZCY0_TETSI|nr:hypothetical protein HHK36_009084 [Tetracentron sinense]